MENNGLVNRLLFRVLIVCCFMIAPCHNLQKRHGLLKKHGYLCPWPMAELDHLQLSGSIDSQKLWEGLASSPYGWAGNVQET